MENVVARITLFQFIVTIKKKRSYWFALQISGLVSL